MLESYKSTDTANRLLVWFSENGRSFIWRERPEPFIILIAEILLKKTSAMAINRFLPDFLVRYGNVQKLNDTLLEELATLLAPLGLSIQRAKQFKELAAALIKSYDGIIPSDRNELLKLPGIGEYTAGAILCFAFGKPEAIVDTNVARVIVRVYGITPSRYEARRSPELWEKARVLISNQAKDAAKINWALLDLGALVCKPRNPKHGECPLVEQCVFVNPNATPTEIKLTNS